MEIQSIAKAVDRTRLQDLGRQYEEIISRDNKESLELQIAQDTAFWELKEKYSQLKSDHDRLQQDMAELQMQYETLSGQYQDELRRHPETCNMVESNEKICDEVMKRVEFAQWLLKRNRADFAELAAAYDCSDQVTAELLQRHQQAVDSHTRRVRELEREVTLKNDHADSMMKQFVASKEQMKEEIRFLKDQLHAASRSVAEITASLSDLNRQLDAFKHDVEKRDEAIADLQREKEQMINNYNTQMLDSKNIIIKVQTDLKNNTEEAESLKRALTNQEEFSRSVCGERDELLEQLAAAEEEQTRTAASEAELAAKLELLSIVCDTQNKDLDKLKEENDELNKELNDKKQSLKLYENDLERYTEKLRASENELENTASELKKYIEESIDKTKKIGNLTAEIEGLYKSLTETKNDFVKSREAADDIQKNLETLIKGLRKELENKTSSFRQVTADLQARVEHCNSLETELKNVQIEKDKVADNLKELEENLNSKICQLETILKAKEEELTDQMTKFLDLRKTSEQEKSNLKKKIEELNTSIHKIRKEVNTGSPLVTADDNAVMLSSGSHLESEVPRTQASALQQNQICEDSLFNDYFSSSENTLDPQDADRYYTPIARKEPLPRPVTSLASLKRGRADTPPPERAPALQPKPTPKPSGQQEVRHFAMFARGQPLTPTTLVPKRRRADTPPPQRAPAVQPKPTLKPPAPQEVRHFAMFARGEPLAPQRALAVQPKPTAKQPSDLSPPKFDENNNNRRNSMKNKPRK